MLESPRNIQNLIVGTMSRNQLAVCRWFLGMGFFFSYLFAARDSVSFVGAMSSVPITDFQAVEHFFAQPSYSIAFYFVAFASSLAFAFGYRVLISGLVSGVLLSVFYLHTPFYFGWFVILLLLMISIFLSSVGERSGKKWAQLPTRLMQISLCLVYLTLTCKQIGQAAWLDPHSIAGDVRASQIGRFDSYRGFIPIALIVVGLAWIGQIMAPFLLWHKAVAKYLASLLMILHLLLMVFCPFAFYNFIAAVTLISFLPKEWFAYESENWSRQFHEISFALRKVSFVFILAVMLCTIFDRNIALQFDIFKNVKGGNVEKAYKIAFSPFAAIGNVILFNSMWKMYSPVWRHVVWIEWYYTKADHSVEIWPQDNFSPDYRTNRRTWLKALWSDFKKEKVFIGMLSGSQEKAAYGAYLCHEIAIATGQKPLGVHPEIYSFDIRGPDAEWSLKDQPFEHKDVKPEIACD